VNLDDADMRAAVERCLGEWAGGRVRVQSWSRLSGGAIQQNIALDLAMPDGCPRRLVLRTDAPSQVPESRTRMQEYALLCAAQLSEPPLAVISSARAQLKLAQPLTPATALEPGAL